MHTAKFYVNLYHRSTAVIANNIKYASTKPQKTSGKYNDKSQANLGHNYGSQLYDL